MKMKKTLVALCLSAGMLACVPGMSLADVNFVPQNTSAAPPFRQRAAAADLDACRSIENAERRFNHRRSTPGCPGIVGPVAAWSVPANIGELTLTLDSEVNKQSRFLRRTC
jgi:maltose operon protein